PVRAADQRLLSRHAHQERARHLHADLLRPNSVWRPADVRRRLRRHLALGCRAAEVSEKTEPPTPKKHPEAPEKGQVAKSRDLVQAVLFIALLGILLGNIGTYTDIMGRLLVLPADLYALPFPVALREVSLAAIDGAFAICTPVIGVTIIAAVAGNV